jgi:hypothetical protein
MYTMASRARPRTIAIVVAVLALGFVAAGMRPAGAAQRPLGEVQIAVEWTVGTGTVRGATAECPRDTVVLGGGAWPISTSGGYDAWEDVNQIVQPTMARPYQDGDEQGFRIRVTELDRGTVYDWQAIAYALCADEDTVSNHRIVPVSSPWQDRGSQRLEAKCGSQKVLGAGAQISFPSTMPLEQQDRLALQVMRASGGGDLVRAQARELSNRPNHLWQLTAYAVCADAPDGYQVVYGDSAARDSEPYKHAVAQCPSGKQVIGAGAAVIDDAPAGVALHAIAPPFVNSDEYPEYRSVSAAATEVLPQYEDWDFMVAQAICATRPA